MTIQIADLVDVATLRWPDDERTRERLALEGAPRLLLVAATTEPPECADCLEDWLRVPGREADIRARLNALAMRQAAHKLLRIDEHGVVSQGGRVTVLAPADYAVARPLIASFGEVVALAALEQKINDDTHDAALTLRVHVSRIRKRLAPFGVSVSCVRNVGYVMHRSHAATAKPND